MSLLWCLEKAASLQNANIHHISVSSVPERFENIGNIPIQAELWVVRQSR